ncbi:MAG: type II toxin-antitoxin system PemK/MazF family toxin [Oscillospiraceae bacterium]
MDKIISQKGVYMCDFSGSKFSEEKGIRPIIICQNNIGNTFSPTIWGIPITSQRKTDLPTHHIIYRKKYPFLKYDENTIIVEQLTTKDKRRLGKYLGKIDDDDFNIIVAKIINNLKQFTQVKI